MPWCNMVQVRVFHGSTFKCPMRWSVFDENLKRWSSYPVQEVMQIVGSAHEALNFEVFKSSR